MKTKLLGLLAAIFLVVDCGAQITNSNFFTPVRITMERMDTRPDSPEDGIWLRFSSDVGRIYRLESSTTLTNWTLVEQVVGDDTNMSFYIPVANMTVISSGGTNGGGGPGPAPGGAMMMSGGGEASESKAKPLPYPWEPAYLPKAKEAGELSMSSGSQNSMQFSFASPPTGLFYRVVCPEDRIQFPGWVDHVDQFLSVGVWTAIQGGTYQLKLYADNTWSIQTPRPCPPADILAFRTTTTIRNNGLTLATTVTANGV